MEVVPHAIRRYLRSRPSYRKVARQCDLQSVAYMAVCKAAFCYNPSKSSVTTYFQTAVRHALGKEIRRRARVQEMRPGSMRIAVESKDGEARTSELEQALQCRRSQLDEGFLRALATMGLTEKHLIEDRVLSHQSVRSLARQAGVDPRTMAKRLRSLLEELARRAADLP